jgi:hypothetical protein
MRCLRASAHTISNAFSAPIGAVKRERSRARSKNRVVTLMRGWRAARQMIGSRCTVHAMIDTASSPITIRNGTEENMWKTPALWRTSVQPP